MLNSRLVARLCWLNAAGFLLAFLYTAVLPAFSANAAAAEFSRSLELPPPDMALWSESRKNAYATQTARKPLGVLRIDRLSVAAPIYVGTKEASLDKGIGHIEGTANVNSVGNVGLAAHRDGFFRPLKDVQIGDKISVETTDETRIYTVRAIDVVAPSNVSVLAPSTDSELTLVTCYPFYFLGSAPERFIVRASL